MATEKDKESGVPGGGAGRKDDVKGSPVYPMSGPHPPGDARIVGQASFGQGERGAAGYEDHGESALNLGPANREQKQTAADERNTEGVVPPRKDPTRDPELEMPDPEQVEEDIKEAEKTYKKDEKKSA
jgi:hypothetical protein